MLKNFYNEFHIKNNKIQERVISDHNYTYQTLIRLTSKYFTKIGHVLDFGCGVGTIVFYLASKGHEVLGVDISDNAITIANKSSKILGFEDNIKFIHGNISVLGRKSKFDYAICSEVLEHVRDDQELIKKIYNSLYRNGLVIVSVPSMNAPLYRWGYLSEFDFKVGHLRRYTEFDLKRKLTREGFQVIRVVKTEGLLRNALYTIESIGFLVRLIRWPVNIFINLVDHIFLRTFGESNIYVIAKKP